MIQNKGYKDMAFYKQSEIIHDFTVEFVKLYINPYSRTKDQMEQSARSGKQNIAEGYTQRSLESRIKLVGVARGSLEELLNDYQDYLRQQNLKTWHKDSAKMRELRDLRVLGNPFPHIPQLPHIPHNPELASNLMIMLCQRITYLLEKQIESLKQKFINEGGFRENLFKQRLEKRNTR